MDADLDFPDLQQVSRGHAAWGRDLKRLRIASI